MRDKAPSIALTAAAVVAILLVIRVFLNINSSEQRRPVNPPSAQSSGDDNTHGQ